MRFAPKPDREGSSERPTFIDLLSEAGLVTVGDLLRAGPDAVHYRLTDMHAEYRSNWTLPGRETIKTWLNTVAATHLPGESIDELTPPPVEDEPVEEEEWEEPEPELAR